MRYTRKYEFIDEAAADTQIATLPHDQEGNLDCKHVVSKLGYVTITPATYDEDGNELTAAVLSEKYAVDVLWYEQIDDTWEPFIVWPTPMGIHLYGSSSSIQEYETTYCQLYPDSVYCNPPEPEEE